MNPLRQLASHGQSLWLDSISRRLLESGELARRIEEDDLRGVTSNPSIFEKAIGAGADYAAPLAKLRAANPGASTQELYEGLAIADIQAAADLLRPVYERTQTRDGYVSLEVTLHRGDDARSITAEARHLWKRVDRANVMIKVPGTDAGVAAFRELIADGINVNVTLLFSQRRYARVAEAYLDGLEARVNKGGDVSKLASVASFFVSRIDTKIDAQLTELMRSESRPSERFLMRALLGKIAIANAKLAYAHYKEVIAGPRWQALAKKGAQTQRVLWASTSTKNPSYVDVVYVEELIGKDTVDTAPSVTIDAFRDHGRARATLESDLDFARDALAALAHLKISLDDVCEELLVEGMQAFDDAFKKLLGTIASSKGGASTTPALATPSRPIALATAKLPDALRVSVDACLDDWKANDKVTRLWKRDASLWTNGDEGRWLGWLDAPRAAHAHTGELTAFAEEIRSAGFTHILLLGMGGSSLFPEVLAKTFGSQQGRPQLFVLDSTDPAQVAGLERKLDLARTLFVVASKSGSTLEPDIFERYFFERVKERAGAKAGEQFVAITDPGSQLEATARAKGYRAVFAGVPAIGGRFSALSNFGLVPAALIGVDVARFVQHAADMARACENGDPRANPAVALGAILGAAAKSGRDKLTLVLSPAVSSFGAWLEQLIAESTGKQGRAIIPIDLEPPGAPESYGSDRVFVYVRHAATATSAQDSGLAALERAGHPVVRLDVDDVLTLGAEIFRFEVATAVAGAVLGIHPFDQPDVEASKVATRALTTEYETKGALPAEKPFFEEAGIQLFGDARTAASLSKSAGKDASLAGHLRALFGQTKKGDYLALLAYLDMNASHTAELQEMRRELRDALRVATCLGFGPRFLHSTGQAYKGGPNSGVFLQLTCTDALELPVPGKKYTFAVVKAAQARGDFQVLVERGRRALRVHLPSDTKSALARLHTALRAALEAHAHAGS
ncbi:MAG: bifunctional transaldolase/phosoglucose isomerase [Planctomycetota bacterium]